MLMIVKQLNNFYVPKICIILYEKIDAKLLKLGFRDKMLSQRCVCIFTCSHAYSLFVKVSNFLSLISMLVLLIIILQRRSRINLSVYLQVSFHAHQDDWFIQRSDYKVFKKMLVISHNLEEFDILTSLF